MSKIQVDNIVDKEGLGAPTFPSGAVVPDDKKIDFGDSDLSIYHQTSPELDIIESDEVLIRGKQGLQNPMGRFNQGEGVKLYYSGTQRVETTTHGVVVAGICTATSFSGDGSSLTGVESWNQFDTWLYG